MAKEQFTNPQEADKFRKQLEQENYLKKYEVIGQRNKAGKVIYHVIRAVVQGKSVTDTSRRLRS